MCTNNWDFHPLPLLFLLLPLLWNVLGFLSQPRISLRSCWPPGLTGMTILTDLPLLFMTKSPFFPHSLTISSVQTRSEPRHSSPAPAWTIPASAWGHPSYPCLPRKKPGKFSGNALQSLQAQTAKTTMGQNVQRKPSKMLPEHSQAGSVQFAYSTQLSGSHLQKDSLLFGAYFFFFVSDTLVITCFFLTLSAESPNFYKYLTFPFIRRVL